MKAKKIKSASLLKKRVVLAGALLAVILAAGGFWLYTRFYLQTDDAYVNANVVQIAPRISGQVIRLHTEDNRLVREGQLLFEIDPASFRVGVEKARAAVDKAKANLEIARTTSGRVNILAKDRVRSVQDKDQAAAALQEALATLHEAQATLAMEELNLSYTKVAAPVTGWVTMLKLRAGDMVDVNKPLFAMVDHREFWVDANFKETELEHISLGQEADIEVDMYPGHYFKGVVDSLSRGSGTAFSLLPPQNATGNWVKVTQRVPVKIRVMNIEPAFPLRIGTTAKVTIKLHPWQKAVSSRG